MMWEPIPGYLNPNSYKIAISDDESSWPETWPDKAGDENDPGWSGSWNGYFGKNQFNAGQEVFYKVSDDRNYIVGYPYAPDTTDLSRRGAGIQVGVRAMEWKQILIEDVVFLLHEVTNDGSYDYDQVAFGQWLADCVGGNGDCDDDLRDFDLINDIAWSLDDDGVGGSAFGTDPVGVGATSFIETPGNNRDRIDNDSDGEYGGPIIQESMIVGEILGNGIDDNDNGLVDENLSHVPVGSQLGVSYSDRIDNNNNGEQGSPLVTEEMIDASLSQEWNIWPNPNDDFQLGSIHIISLDEVDLNAGYADGIDNNVDIEDPYALEYPIGLGADVNSPLVTQAMIDMASTDVWKRYRVPDTDIISVSAVGSLKEELAPGKFVIVDQFIDRTFARNKTFFDDEIVAHVSMAHPTSNGLMNACEEAIKKENIDFQRGGTYVVMEGPQFSTLAESNLYRSWKADVIGMTNMPEAKLAREAEIRYASVSMVTDYDCWHPDHENVDVQQVIKVLLDNAAKAKNMIKNLIDNFENHIDPNDPTNNCLDVAIITAPEKRTQKTKDKLKTIAGRVLNK